MIQNNISSSSKNKNNNNNNSNKTKGIYGSFSLSCFYYILAQAITFAQTKGKISSCLLSTTIECKTNMKGETIIGNYYISYFYYLVIELKEHSCCVRLFWQPEKIY